MVAPDEVSLLDTVIFDSKAIDVEAQVAQIRSDLEAASEGARVAELAYELGEFLQRHFSDESAAVKAYGRALKADPSLRVNLWAIRRIFYSRKLWPNLVKLIGAELRFVSDDSQRADNLVERGTILYYRLNDAELGRESFEEALQYRNDDVSALLALESIARASGDQDCLWRTLRSLASSSSSPQRKTSLLVELAREYRLSRGNWDEAKELLAEAGKSGVLLDSVAREREALARAMDDPAALVASLETRIAWLSELGNASTDSAEVDLGSNVREIVAMRRHQARVLIDSDDSNAAWDCLQEGLTLAPTDNLLLADLTQLAEALGRFDQLAELAFARESGETDTRRALALALQRSSALAKAGKEVEAEELLQARSRSMPGFLPLVVAREVHAAKRDDWQELANLQAELGDAIVRGACFGDSDESDTDESAAQQNAAKQNAAEHYVVAGDYSQYGDRDSALVYYQKAMELVPGHRAAALALSVEYCARRQFDDAVEALRSSSGQDDLDTFALEMLSNLLFLQGDKTEELKVLQRLHSQFPDRQDLTLRILELYRELVDYAAFASASRVYAQKADDPDMQAKYYFDAGYAYFAEASDFSEAAACFKECWERWPDDIVVAELHFIALRNSGNWQGVVEHLGRQALVSSGDDLIGIGRHSLAIVEHQLKDSKRACASAISLLEQHADDQGAMLDACAVLAASLPGVVGQGDAEHKSALIDIVELLAASKDGEMQGCLQMWLATLHAGEGRSAEAQRWASESSQTGLLPALLLRLELAIEEGDIDAQSEILSEISATLSASEDQGSLLEQAGWHQLAAQQDESALGYFLQSIAKDDSRIGSRLGQVLALAMANADSEVQHSAVASLAGLCGAPYTQSALLLRAAMIAEASGDGESAANYVDSAHRLCPDDTDVLVAAADRILPMRADGRKTDGAAMVASIAGKRADISPPESYWEWKLTEGEALERLGKLPEARAIAIAALSEPAHRLRGLRLLRGICQRNSDSAGVAHCAMALASTVSNSESRQQLLREAIAHFDPGEELPIEASAAVICYASLLREDGGAREFSRLIEILQSHKDSKSLYHTYTRRLAHLEEVGEAGAAVPIFLMRSRLRESLGDLRGAQRDVSRALGIERDHPDALSMRGQLQASIDAEEGSENV